MASERDEMIEKARGWYSKQDYSPNFPLAKIMADFHLSQTPGDMTRLLAFEAGQRDERVRIAKDLEEFLKVTHGKGSGLHGAVGSHDIRDFIEKLTDPTEEKR